MEVGRLFRLKDPWPLRLAAVEAGKWVCGRPGRRFRFDACQLVLKDGAGTTDRNCRLLLSARESDSLALWSLRTVAPRLPVPRLEE